MNDYTGSDDLNGVMGPLRFPIGSFTVGSESSAEIYRIIPVNEIYLKIFESDTTGDDEIGTINLAEEMDVDTTRNVQGGGANYDITYCVQSNTD
jgi:hypothetical protein